MAGNSETQGTSCSGGSVVREMLLVSQWKRITVSVSSPSQTKKCKKIELDAKSDIEEIVYRRFSLEEVPKAYVAQMQTEFLEEQASIVYRKAIEDYRVDSNSGAMMQMNEKEKKDYETGIADAFLNLAGYYKFLGKNEEALALFKEILSLFPDTPVIETGPVCYW